MRINYTKAIKKQGLGLVVLATIIGMIVAGLFYALLLTPVYLFFGYKWAISIWAVLMGLNFWTVLRNK